jgi:RHS repeat-associated protein
VLGSNTISYQYDEKGSLTAKLSGAGDSTIFRWNAKGELSQAEVINNGVTTTLSFDYDASGMRVSKINDGIETRYLLDNNFSKYAQVIEEYEADATLQSRYTIGNQLLSRKDDLHNSFYLVDGHGSIRLTTDPQSTVQDSYHYDAFGVTSGASITSNNNNLFAGEQFDQDLGLYYLRARYYDPEIGILLARDPAPGFTRVPLTLSDYIYSISNPVSYLDPSGESIISCIISWVKAHEATIIPFAALLGGVAAISSVLANLSAEIRGWWSFFYPPTTPTPTPPTTPPGTPPSSGPSHGVLPPEPPFGY